MFQAPVGRIFFTGEHTSERFNGYVHGGYLAGEELSRVCNISVTPKTSHMDMNLFYLAL